ncbi:MAG: type II toxin-antitoxin system HicB family antitoxin [Roseiflexaceae bacterium]
MMEYKGYLAKVEFDNEANLFHGQVVNIPDVITFQGQTVDELRQALADSVEDYLEFCAERNEEPEKPFSGRFLVRTDPSLHREIAIAASRANQSINAWINDVLLLAVRSRSSMPPIAVSSEVVLSIHRTMAASFVYTQRNMQNPPPVQNKPVILAKTQASIQKSRMLFADNIIPSDELRQLIDSEEVIADAC